MVSYNPRDRHDNCYFVHKQSKTNAYKSQFIGIAQSSIKRVRGLLKIDRIYGSCESHKIEDNEYM